MKHDVDLYAHSYSIDQEMRTRVFLEEAGCYIEGKDVLDLGIGDAISYHQIKQLARTYDVVDGSLELVKSLTLTPQEKTRIRIYCNRFENFFPERNGKLTSYDCIIMSNILEHLNDPELVLSRYRQFLKPGGRVALSVPNANALNKLVAVKAGMLKSIFELTENDISFGHKRIYTVDTIHELAEKSGYIIEKTVGQYLKPITTAQMEQLGFDLHIHKALVEIGKEYPTLASNIMVVLRAKDIAAATK